MPALERSCLSPAGEVAARSADGEGDTRDVQRPSPTSVLSAGMCKDDAIVQPSQSPSVTAPPKGEPRCAATPALERSCLSLRERWQRAALTERGYAGRPEAVPYICPLGGNVRVEGITSSIALRRNIVIDLLPQRAFEQHAARVLRKFIAQEVGVSFGQAALACRIREDALCDDRIEV